MRNPMLYVSGLQRAAGEMDCTCDPSYIGPPSPSGEFCLKHELEGLADTWQDLANWGGELMMETYQLTGKEITEWPWVVPRHPALAKFHKNILTNDVT